MMIDVDRTTETQLGGVSPLYSLFLAPPIASTTISPAPCPRRATLPSRDREGADHLAVGLARVGCPIHPGRMGGGLTES